jgi:heme oxygenase
MHGSIPRHVPHDRLVAETQPHQQELLSIPFARAAVAGRLSLDEYVAFLGQAYHHVKHTVPLLMAAGSRVGPDQPGLQAAFAAYIDEERGHEQWILDDIDACGGDAGAVRRSTPGLAADVLVAYAYDVIQRRNPLGFLGMVHVLEGTSVLAATQAANALRSNLGLPERAFRYLSSHGALDLDHVDHFADIMDSLEPADVQLVIDHAKTFFTLYGDVLRSLSPTESSSAQESSAC